MPKRKPKDVMSWGRFRALYEDRAISTLAPKTQDHWYRIADEFERVCKPKLVADLNGEKLAKYVDHLKERGIKASTCNDYIAKLKAAGNWAHGQGILSAPLIYKDKRLKVGGTTIPSRAVTDLEFTQILEAVPVVRKHDAGLWQRFLRALHWSDLRVSEALRLSWEIEAPVRLLRSAQSRDPLLHRPCAEERRNRAASRARAILGDCFDG